MAKSVEGFKATREPVLGSLASLVGVGLALATPMWVIALALVHAEIVRRAASSIVMGGGVPVDEAGEVLTGQQVYWELLTSPWLLLYSLTVATLIVSCLMLLMFFAVAVWRLSARWLAPASERRAHAKYGAMVDGPVELTTDAWNRNLPVRSAPLSDAELEAVEVRESPERSIEE